MSNIKKVKSKYFPHLNFMSNSAIKCVAEKQNCSPLYHTVYSSPSDNRRRMRNYRPAAGGEKSVTIGSKYMLADISVYL